MRSSMPQCAMAIANLISPISNKKGAARRPRPVSSPSGSLLLEREPEADPPDARVHDLERLVEVAGVEVVLPAERRGVVEQVEHVEVDRRIVVLVVQRLADSTVERVHG